MIDRTKPTVEELEAILTRDGDDIAIEIAPDGSIRARAVNDKIDWPDPTPEMLDDPEFNAIWGCIKKWDVNVPNAYHGYCGATGNHARAILDALKAVR